jgi:hypothetical protein
LRRRISWRWRWISLRWIALGRGISWRGIAWSCPAPFGELRLDVLDFARILADVRQCQPPYERICHAVGAVISGQSADDSDVRSCPHRTASTMAKLSGFTARIGEVLAYSTLCTHADVATDSTIGTASADVHKGAGPGGRREGHHGSGMSGGLKKQGRLSMAGSRLGGNLRV